MALLRKLFWFCLFAVFTLAFMVLFEHGVANFPENFVKQVREAQAFVEKAVLKKGAEQAQISPAVRE